MNVVKAGILQVKTNNKARTLEAKYMIYCPGGSSNLYLTVGYLLQH
jgi:hypothetical protein